MKIRYALVAGLILMLVGVVAFGAKYYPSAQANLNIGVELIFGCDGELTFGPNAPLAGSINVYTSASVICTLEANCDFKMEYTLTQFKATVATVPYYLPTKWLCVLKVGGVVPAWWPVPAETNFPDKTGNPPQSLVPSLIPFSYHLGRVCETKFWIEVTRDGYADHYGSYVANMTGTITYPM